MAEFADLGFQLCMLAAGALGGGCPADGACGNRLRIRSCSCWSWSSVKASLGGPGLSSIPTRGGAGGVTIVSGGLVAGGCSG